MLFCELGHIAALLQLALKRLKLGAALELAHHLLKARADQPRVVNTRITRRRACRRPIGKSLIGLAADAGGGRVGVYADFFKCLGYLALRFFGGIADAANFVGRFFGRQARIGQRLLDFGNIF